MTIDVVIPVHAPDRDVETAIASVDSARQGTDTRVILVLHNLELPEQWKHLADRVEVVECHDGIASPSGPRNVGIARARGEFVFLLDSDDEVAPGALGRLHRRAVATGADVVLPGIRRTAGPIGTPLARNRSEPLDCIRDGLFYRSHSFGLFRVGALRETGIRFPEGVRTGQDLVFMSELYVRLTVAFDPEAVYLLHDHDTERVTTTEMPVADQIAAPAWLVDQPWVRDLSPDTRLHLAVRLLSLNVAHGWRRRVGLGHGVSSAAYAAVVDRALVLAPGALRYLSVRDRVTLALDDGTPSPLRRALLSRPFALVPTSARGLVSRTGPIGVAVRGALVRRRVASDTGAASLSSID